MFNISHFCITVSDIERSLNFYKRLGFEVDLEYLSEDNNEKIYMLKMKNGNTMLELVRFSDCEAETPKYDLKKVGVKHFALITDSIEDAKKLFVEQLGIKEEIKIEQSVLERKYFFVKDPDGIVLEIVENTKR